MAGPARSLVPLLVYRSFFRVPNVGNPEGEAIAKRYVAKKGDRWYAITAGPTTGAPSKERRSWRPAGTSLKDAERLAARLAAKLNGRNDEGRSLSFGANPTTRVAAQREARVGPLDVGWVPAQDRPAHPPYARKGGDPPAAPDRRRTQNVGSEDGVGDSSHHTWSPQRCLAKRHRDTQRCPRGHAPRLIAIPKVEQQAWTARHPQGVLRAAAGHRLFPALWLISTTGLRRSELLGLQWQDVDLKVATLSINRGLVSVGYDLHESRGKTSNSRRAIDLDATAVRVLSVSAFT